jgi:hypothetical protein
MKENRIQSALSLLLPKKLSLWEGLSVLALIGFVVRQLLSFGLTEDPDPDGYVSAARYIQSFGHLPDYHRRLPGYPVFLAIVDWIGPGNMHHDVYWAQLGLSLGLVVVMWWVVRHYFGNATALVFLALLAAPNFLMRYSVVMLADFVMQLLWLAYLACVLLYYRQSVKTLSYFLLGLTLLTVVIYLVHPGSKYLLSFFLVSALGVSWFCRHRVDRQRLGLFQLNRRLVYKSGLALVLVVLLTSVADHAYGAGRANFHERWLGWRICLCLPPVHQTPLDQDIEAAKAKISAKLGYLVEDATPNLYPETEGIIQISGDPLRLMATPLSDREQQVYAIGQERLQHYPLRFLNCAWNEMRLRHYIIAKQFFPFISERRFQTLFLMPQTDSLVSRLYRATGIELAQLPANSSGVKVGVAFSLELVKLLGFYGLTLLGIYRFNQRVPIFPLALVLTFILWFSFLSLAVQLETRYLNPFAPFLYLSHAIAISWLISWAFHRFRAKV